MIFDNIENCQLYYGIHERFKDAFDFIKQAVKDNYDCGRYEIDGKNLFAFIQEYSTKPENEGMYEGHKNYIDIQFIVSGIEEIHDIDINKATIKIDYNAEKDIAFYNDSSRAAKSVLEAGEYGIFLPKDLHKPGVSFDNKISSVKKIVVKVKV